eukprot:CAMPEP_0118940750 /NCGR_PEP_ID=MMETSP1169-20130426/32182_1 /TAXON_ID=36882 /ORGANISM="Pyramimonas obovata, Strain CCMP722" /LENGTH=227 /DNA_ID=CAMNT_0006885325 /DNA_START=309 /DNA_END=989 /DNA_ORIENTATION=+
MDNNTHATPDTDDDDWDEYIDPPIILLIAAGALLVLFLGFLGLLIRHRKRNPDPTTKPITYGQLVWLALTPFVPTVTYSIFFSAMLEYGDNVYRDLIDYGDDEIVGVKRRNWYFVYSAACLVLAWVSDMRLRLAAKGAYGAIVWKLNEVAIVALAAVGCLFSADQYPAAPLAVSLLLGPSLMHLLRRALTGPVEDEAALLKYLGGFSAVTGLWMSGAWFAWWGAANE